jgi:hypothetical protein
MVEPVLGHSSGSDVPNAEDGLPGQTIRVDCSLFQDKLRAMLRGGVMAPRAKLSNQHAIGRLEIQQQASTSASDA